MAVAIHIRRVDALRVVAIRELDALERVQPPLFRGDDRKTAVSDEMMMAMRMVEG
jgi:hypothetical protein